MNNGLWKLFGILLVIIGAIIGFTSAQATNNADIEQLKIENDAIHPVVIQNNKDIAVMNVQIDNIDRNVEKILDRLEE